MFARPPEWLSTLLPTVVEPISTTGEPDELALLEEVPLETVGHPVVDEAEALVAVLEPPVEDADALAVEDADAVDAVVVDVEAPDDVEALVADDPFAVDEPLTADGLTDEVLAVA